ncbi:hypothetical protein FKW77_001055 [Venturia effusa]|uniref:Uncharacterized protein n=1 Tax=Venturia effusa TaxID=50376 RepID=A0A517LKZ9_9PEZI|nr:hypothetical protein FKW77_001055 [Venturia effusa]
MAANILGLTRNFSFYTIPAAWVLSIAPHFYAASLGGKKFDNRNPRTYIPSLASDQTFDQTTKNTIIRAEGAQQNGFENLGIFAAAVLAGNYAKLDNETLNWLSMGYLGSRVVYNFLYINNTSDVMANARTVSFLSGIGIIFTLFVKSGNAIRNSV